jgi:SAM-dependent methyltransferase
MWATAAGRWAEHAEFVDERVAPVTEAMIAATRPAPGERVLELACGAGGVGLAAAQLVGGDGEVVVSDGVAEMTDIAATRAAERGLTNVSARVLDLDAIDEPDGAYDVVVCREGLMFARDHAHAAREIRRVLRPGGRVAIAAWGPRERNPWLATVLDAASEQFGAPVPPPGVRGPFELDDARRLEELLTQAGLRDVVVDEVPVPYRAATIAEWWTRTTALAGPLAQVVATLPDEVRRELEDRAHAKAEAYETTDGIAFPGVSLVARAHV